MFAMFLLSTFAIILSNYIFEKNTRLEIKDYIQTLEYSKFWWEENYKILNEIQREQTATFLEDLKTTNPEYIEEIRKKLNMQEEEKNIFTDEEIDALYNSWYMTWSTDSDYSIIEFSSYDCEFCYDLHEQIDFFDLSENNDFSYYLKNMSDINDENIFNLSKKISCINDNDFKKEVFNNSWIDEKNIFVDDYIQSNNLDLSECINSESTTQNLQDQFWQGIYLWVEVLPTIFVINNSTWEYSKIEWSVSEEEFLQKIEELKNSN